MPQPRLTENHDLSDGKRLIPDKIASPDDPVKIGALLYEPTLKLYTVRTTGAVPVAVGASLLALGEQLDALIGPVPSAALPASPATAIPLMLKRKVIRRFRDVRIQGESLNEFLRAAIRREVAARRAQKQGDADHAA